MTKVCCRCKIDKDVSNFHKSSLTRDGLRRECVDCRNKYYKNNRKDILERRRLSNQANPEKYHRQKKEWYYRHREQVLLSRKEKWAKAHVREQLKEKKTTFNQTLLGKYGCYKRTAKFRQLEFELTLEEFKWFWQKPCAYGNHPIETIGLDRINSNLGYKLGNVLPCCPICNMAKSTRDIEKFLEWRSGFSPTNQEEVIKGINYYKSLTRDNVFGTGRID